MLVEFLHIMQVIDAMIQLITFAIACQFVAVCLKLSQKNFNRLLGLYLQCHSKMIISWFASNSLFSEFEREY